MGAFTRLVIGVAIRSSTAISAARDSGVNFRWSKYANTARRVIKDIDGIRSPRNRKVETNAFNADASVGLKFRDKVEEPGARVCRVCTFPVLFGIGFMEI